MRRYGPRAVLSVLVFVALTVLGGYAVRPSAAAGGTGGPAWSPVATPAKQSKHPDPQTSYPSPSTECAKKQKTIVPVPWPQKMLTPQRAWPFADGSGVTVAVLDSGVDGTQPQLSGHVDAGADFLYSPGTGAGNRDCVGHGTEVSSIIAGQRSAATGFEGVAPGARILPVLVTEKEVLGNGDTSGNAVGSAAFGQAVRWAVDHGATVLNMSLVQYDDDAALRSAVRYAVAHDVVVVAAVGNNGAKDAGNDTPYPASYPGVIGVGAVQQDGTRWDSSQHGTYVDVVAPGASVVAAARGGGHQVVNGTSFAAPFVSGVAALVRSRYPKMSAAAVAARVVATADPADGGQQDYGNGIVDPYRAVTEPLSSASPRPLPALARASHDAVAEQRAVEQAHSGRIALIAAAGIAAVVGAALFVALALPRGRRNRWRARLARAPEPPADRSGRRALTLFGPDPDAPDPAVDDG